MPTERPAARRGVHTRRHHRRAASYRALVDERYYQLSFFPSFFSTAQEGATMSSGVFCDGGMAVWRWRLRMENRCAARNTRKLCDAMLTRGGSSVDECFVMCDAVAIGVLVELYAITQ